MKPMREIVNEWIFLNGICGVGNILEGIGNHVLKLATQEFEAKAGALRREGYEKAMSEVKDNRLAWHKASQEAIIVNGRTWFSVVSVKKIRATPCPDAPAEVEQGEQKFQGLNAYEWYKEYQKSQDVITDYREKLEEIKVARANAFEQGRKAQWEADKFQLEDYECLSGLDVLEGEMTPLTTAKPEPAEPIWCEHIKWTKHGWVYQNEGKDTSQIRQRALKCDQCGAGRPVTK